MPTAEAFLTVASEAENRVSRFWLDVLGVFRSVTLLGAWGLERVGRVEEAQELAEFTQRHTARALERVETLRLLGRCHHAKQLRNNSGAAVAEKAAAELEQQEKAEPTDHPRGAGEDQIICGSGDRGRSAVEQEMARPLREIFEDGAVRRACKTADH